MSSSNISIGDGDPELMALKQEYNSHKVANEFGKENMENKPQSNKINKMFYLYQSNRFLRIK